MTTPSRYIRWFSELGVSDVASVGGKNASLGEMLSNLAPAGVKVPNELLKRIRVDWRVPMAATQHPRSRT